MRIKLTTFLVFVCLKTMFNIIPFQRLTLSSIIRKLLPIIWPYIKFQEMLRFCFQSFFTSNAKAMSNNFKHFKFRAQDIPLTIRFGSNYVTLAKEKKLISFWKHFNKRTKLNCSRCLNVESEDINYSMAGFGIYLLWNFRC